MEIADIPDIWRKSTIIYTWWSDCCVNFSSWLAKYNFVRLFLTFSLSLSVLLPFLYPFLPVGTRGIPRHGDDVFSTGVPGWFVGPGNYEVSAGVIGNYRFLSDYLREWESSESSDRYGLSHYPTRLSTSSIVSRVPSIEQNFDHHRHGGSWYWFP